MPDSNPFSRPLVQRAPGPELGVLLARGLATAVKALAVFTLIALATGYALSRGRLEPCRLDSTETAAQQVRSAVTMFLAEVGADAGVRAAQCPAVSELVAGGFLSGRRSVVDSWGHPFRIRCEGTRVTVISPGADGRFGTPDDID